VGARDTEQEREFVCALLLAARLHCCVDYWLVPGCVVAYYEKWRMLLLGKSKSWLPGQSELCCLGFGRSWVATALSATVVAAVTLCMVRPCLVSVRCGRGTGSHASCQGSGVCVGMCVVHGLSKPCERKGRKPAQLHSFGPFKSLFLLSFLVCVCPFLVPLSPFNCTEWAETETGWAGVGTE
jgi:hypothetical protein